MAQGTVQELLEHSTSAQKHRVMTFEAAAGLDVSALLRPGLSCTETRPGSYSLAGELESADLGRFGSWCAQHHIMPTAVHLASQSLEDVFLAISNGGLSAEPDEPAESDLAAKTETMGIS